MPSRARCSGVVYVIVAPLQAHDAARRRAEPGDRAQDRRLARAVRAEQREHLALPHLEAHVEQHLHRAVREVDVVDLERGDVVRASTCWRVCSAISSRSSATTSDRSLRMNRALRMIRNPPMIVDGTTMASTAAPRAERVGQAARRATRRRSRR